MDVLPDPILVSTPAQSTVSVRSLVYALALVPGKGSDSPCFPQESMHEEVCGSPNWQIYIEKRRFV